MNQKFKILVKLLRNFDKISKPLDFTILVKFVSQILIKYRNFSNSSILVGFLILFLLSSASAYTIIGGGECTCCDCTDCNNALNDSDCTVVNLNNNIIDYNGTCIDNPSGFNNKVFDCQGHNIDGIRSNYGIYADNRENLTIKNCILTDWNHGIYLQYSNSSSITNNTANSNYYNGIHLQYSSNNIITNNTANSIWNGIYLQYSNNNTLINNNPNSNYRGINLYYSNNNTLTNNTANSNDVDGIYLQYSNSNIIINNTADSNSDGITLHHSNSNIITNNTADSNNYGIHLIYYSNNNNITDNNLTSNNRYSLYEDGIGGCNSIGNNIGGDSGKPIRYEHNISGITISNTDEYSEIIFCRVTNSLIDNVTISNPGTTSNGILFVYSYNNTIRNSNMSNDFYGIYLWYSNNNTITNNTANSNSDGVSLYHSTGNTLTDNTANSNGKGISLHYSSDSNNIINNTANSNGYGISLIDSKYTNIINNTASSNDNGICLSSSSNNNTLANNTANSNNRGIYLGSSSGNTLKNNIVNSNNKTGINLYRRSSNNTITNNTANSNNGTGIYLYYNSNFNNISNNKILNNTQGIAISNCDPQDPWMLWCPGGNTNNILEENYISNNNIGIYSRNSNSIINSNTVCNNTNLDFISPDWLLSSGTNNTCDNLAGWNDKTAVGGGCRYKCSMQPKLDIEKWTSDPCSDPGGTVTYHVRVRNTGTATATAIRVTDSLPNYGDGGYFNYTANFSDCQDGRAISNKPLAGDTSFNVTLPDLAGAWNGSGEHCEFSYVVDLEEDLHDGMYTNIAEVTGTDLNNTALQSDRDEAYITIWCCSCSASALSLEVERISPIDGDVEINEDIIYNVTVWNAGNTPFASLDCWDEIDESFQTITALDDTALEAVTENSVVSVQPVFKPTSDTTEGVSIYEVSCIANDSNGNVYSVTDIGHVYVFHCVTPYDNMHINNDTVLCQGTYNISDDPLDEGVIIINSSNIVLDCNDTVLNGDGTGYGIVNLGFDNVTIKNCRVMNYNSGIFIFNSYSNFLINNTVKNNEYGIFSEKSSSLIENNILNSNNFGIKIDDSYCSIKHNVTPDTILFFYATWCSHCQKMEPWIQQLEQEGYKFHWAEYRDAGAMQVVNDCMPIITSGGVPHFGCTSNGKRNLGEFSSIDSMRNFADGCRKDAEKYNSRINSNMVCFNSNSDFSLNNSHGSSGDNNTCTKADGWSDTNKQGCSFSCPYYTLHLKPDWNLISIPLKPENDSLLQVLAPIQGKYDRVFTYKNGWSYKADYDGIWQGTLDKMKSRTGYWVRMKEAANLTINGYVPDKNIYLSDKWNLIGWPSNETLPLLEALASINHSCDKVFAYDQSRNWEYKVLHDGAWQGSLNVMEQGRGYWIHMKEEGVLQVH